MTFSAIRTIFFTLAFQLPAAADLSPYPHHLAVTPHPQEVYGMEGSTGAFQINSGTTIRVSHGEDLPGAELIAADIERRSGILVAVVQDGDKADPGANVIHINRSDDKVDPGSFGSISDRTKIGKAEGYSLIVLEDRVLLRGVDARGAVYGAQTIRQLLRHDMTLPALAIRDWPEMPERQVYGLYNGDFRSRAGIEAYVERALLLKYNAIVFESIWNANENWWFNFTGERREWATYFKETCEKYHMEFIPLIQGPGWGYGITDQAPMLTTGVWIEREKLKLGHGAPTALAKSNVVTNESAPIKVTDLTGRIAYQKDKDFKIIPGTTVRPYAAGNLPWKLQGVEGGAIGDGQEVLVSYNAVTKATAHQSWNISDPEAFRILDFTLDRVQKEMEPSSIHIGHDEIWQLGTDSRDTGSGFSPARLVQRELMHWYHRIRKNDAETIIFMWDDLMRPVRTGVSNGILTETIDEIPKDIVVVPWHYEAGGSSAETIRKRLEHLTKHGFGVIGASSGYWRDNSWLWYQELRPFIEEGKARGMMFTVWDALHRGDMVVAGELMWSGKRVERERFKLLGAVGDRMKAQGIVFTLSPRVQMGAYAAVVSRGLTEGKSPDQIATDFKAKTIGDTAAFEEMLGSDAWGNLGRDAVFPEQEVGNLVRVPLFLQAMTDYVKADGAQDRGHLQSVIGSLQELDHIGFAERNELLKRSKTGWIPFNELFGIDQPAGE